MHHILDFLGDFAKHIVFQGVHMVYNAQGHPSGEAFIQMEAEAAAQTTALDRHNKYMQIGRKHRYIEVFQCSADDMSLTLAAPIAQPPPPQAVARLPNPALLQMQPNGARPAGWPYPSPPVSPSNAAYYAALNQQQQAFAVSSSL